MISGIIGLPCPLLDDNSFGVATTSSYLRINIILPIGASWKTSLSIAKVTPSDVARQRQSTSLFELFEQIVGFLGRCCERGWSFDLTRRTDDGIGIQGAVPEVGSSDHGDQRQQAKRAQQMDKQTDEPNSSPSRGEHRGFFLGKTVIGSTTVAFFFQEGQTTQRSSPRHLDVCRSVC